MILLLGGKPGRSPLSGCKVDYSIKTPDAQDKIGVSRESTVLNKYFAIGEKTRKILIKCLLQWRILCAIMAKNQ